MDKTKLKIRVDNVTQIHVSLTVFMGDENETLANCGQLTMLHPEYQLFATALMIATSATMAHHLVVDVQEEKWTEFYKLNPGE